MKKRLAAAAIAVAAGGAYLWDSPERPRTYDAGACRAVDGDTLDCDGRRVRLANIDAPELQGRCAAEIQMAERAKLAAMIALAVAPVHVVPERGKDRYGRLIARVAVDGRDLGGILIAQGLARPYAGGARSGWCG
ncbi:MAG: thermonuclease family protein [Tagaea sp.]|nr:thermonuclease family protein [Tagaea sp.]